MGVIFGEDEDIIKPRFRQLSKALLASLFLIGLYYLALDPSTSGSASGREAGIILLISAGGMWALFRIYPTQKFNSWVLIPGAQDKESSGSSSAEVEEFKRTCQECGKTWHTSVEREESLQESKSQNAFVQFATALGGNLGAATQSKRNVEAQEKELEELQRCPVCGSQNYQEEKIRFEK